MKILGIMLLVAAVLLTLVVGSRVLIEKFGMSPGTLTQLQSTNVPRMNQNTPYLLF
jgi:hypothetical protein